jgi:hypothetical protein
VRKGFALPEVPQIFWGSAPEIWNSANHESGDIHDIGGHSPENLFGVLRKREALPHIRRRSRSCLLQNAAGKDSCEAKNGKEGHDLLEALQLVAGNDHLIAGNEVSDIRSSAFVDSAHVYWNRL